jgi:tetratricopeptide (TPR) repeat protein
MDIATGNLQRVALGLLLTCSLIAVPPVMAEPGASAPVKTKDFKHEAIAKAKQEAEGNNTKYSAEAVVAIKAVEQAIALLDEGKDDEAIKKLQEADGKLEIAIAADPNLKLIPVAASVMTYDLVTTSEAVKDELKVVNELLRAGNVQDARLNLGQLRSEIVTSHAYLPTETYPDAIKHAVELINSKQDKMARDTLADAMESLVEETEVTPLPVVLAQGALLEAEKVRETNKEEALRDLAYASEQIETADRLGYFYGDSDDYKSLTRHMDAIQTAIAGKSKIDELFDDAKTGIKSLLDKTKGKKIESTQ